MTPFKIRKLHLLTVGSVVIVLLAAVLAGVRTTDLRSGDAGLSAESDGGEQQEMAEGLGIRADVLKAASEQGLTKIDKPLPRAAAAAGWSNETLFAKNNDWEPAVAADPGAPYVYMLTTRYSTTPACEKCPRPFIPIRISSDGGATWGKADFLCKCKGFGWQADPQIEVAANGTVFAAFLSNPFDVYVIRSTDHGMTWSDPIDVSDAPGIKWGDHEWIGVSDNGMDVYVGFNFHANYQVTSHDGGLTWGAPIKTTADADIEQYFANGVTITPGGTIVFADAAYGCCKYNDVAHKRPIHLWAIRSTDSGATWTQVPIDTVESPPVCKTYKCPAAMYGSLPSIASDAAGKLIYTYSGGYTPHGPQQIWVRTSIDGGVTWSAATALSPAGVQVAYMPMAAATGAGDFRVAWSDNRNGNRRFNVWYRSSTDGGATWSPEALLSNLPGGVGYKHADGFQFFYGDYGEMDITNTGKSIVVWAEAYNYWGPGNTWFAKQT